VVRTQIWFVGVSTAGSAALTAFPAWARSLGLDADLVGVDLPVNTSDDAYRQLVARFRASTEVIGAVITGHKARVFETARDQLDAVSDAAWRCREISVLHRDADRVTGTAIEVLSSAAALREIVSEDHWATRGRHLLILGAGGTAAALISAIFDRSGAGSIGPSAVHLIDLVPSRARQLAEHLSRLSPDTAVSVHRTEQASSVLTRLPPGSLIVNATGVGKDTPGSPVPLPAPWPEQAIFWEINYRGERPLLRDATDQAPTRGLAVHDGWKLFVAGWSEALAAILDRSLTGEDRVAIGRAALGAGVR
jgi:shikimate 5-dehydrogenase